MTLSPLVKPYECLLLDLDGCVWVGEEATPRAGEAVDALRAAGKRVGFVTNDARRSEEGFVRKLWGLGMRASVDEIVTVGGTVQFFLAERADRLSTAFVIGSAALHDHVSGAGLRVLNDTDLAVHADVVVAGGHDGFDYEALKTGTLAVAHGAMLVGTARDPSFPMPDGQWPGTGALIAALEYATGVEATVVGKPAPDIFLTALDRLGAEPQGTLMVGDRLDGDIGGAAAAGLDAAVVLTGASTREAAEAALEDPDEDAPRPIAVADDLGSLVLGSLS
jgi:HAD superfamily hydrolase (TIGR01450 family)